MEHSKSYSWFRAAPGDTLVFRCYSYKDLDVCVGGGCFLINDICRCYSFENHLKPAWYVALSTTIEGKPCNINLGVTYTGFGIFSYRHQIPLDAGGVTCPKEQLIFLYGEYYNLNLSEYITANFEIKNLEISITENYEYFRFKSNNERLKENNKFKILNNELQFYSKENKNIEVKFTNFGIIITPDKQCILNIRVCHKRCLDCFNLDSDDNNHQCKQFRNGYYPVEDNYNCWTNEDIIGKNYYFDEEEKMFKRCY